MNLPNVRKNLQTFWGFLTLSFLFLGLAASVILVSQKQELRKEATTTPITCESNITDNFEGDFDSTKWSHWGTMEDRGRIEQKNGKLEIEIPSGMTEYTGANVDSYHITGDFQATAELTIVQGGEAYGADTGLIFHDDDWKNQFNFSLRKESDGSAILYAKTLRNDQWSEVGKRSYSHFGPLIVRLARVGGNVKFSTKEGGSFVLVGEASTGTYQGDGKLSLHVNSWEPNFPAILSTFDNFSLTCPGEPPASGDCWSTGDFDCNGEVDLLDFEIFRDVYVEHL